MNIASFITNFKATSGASRLALNTLIIYGQRITSALLSLITTPLILNSLGVEDYGIYTVTTGLIGMMAFINWSLSSTTQRYIAFSLGEKKTDKLKQIFASSLAIHLIYGLLLFMIISVVGIVFIDQLLNIPAPRIEAAKTILIFIAGITFVNIVTVPITGLFRAHENFLYIALLGVTESVLKLGIAISLLYISADKLIIYSLMLLGVTILTFLANLFFGIRFYREINFNLKNLNLILIKEMLSFMGWSLIGAVAVMSRSQAVAVLLNIFFGVIKNAAYGIAMQVNAAVGILSQGIIASISPRIMKLAGAGDTDKMVYLMRTMSKMAVLVVSIVILPFLFEASYILKLWLKNVPDDAVLFSKLILGFGLIMLQSAGINQVFEAIGKVKEYNIWVSLILIMNIPISYILFTVGLPAWTTITTGMVLELISLFVRLILLKKYLQFSIPDFLNDIFLKIATPMIIASSLVAVLHWFGGNELQQLITTFLVFFTIYPASIFIFSLDKQQKKFFITISNSILRNYFKNKL
jgi:O-antigen/teichoic acid export membrane protein